MEKQEAEKLQKFDVLLCMECQDQELFAWFLKRENPEDSGLAEMVRFIVESRGQ